MDLAAARIFKIEIVDLVQPIMILLNAKLAEILAT
jgi:hypothetical protein